MRIQRRCRGAGDKAHAEIYRLRRATLETYIEELIALLDAIDGDTDLEDDEIEDIDERELPFATVKSEARL
ncbi:hypothetical protein FHP24_09880 [Aliirhizobium smilacinae]|uniref:Uncharacterized protein n=2 Tax=Aliirhizobium smilacinae TaxID=1395944 RepID=A0A5C4XUG1_9HYPH|nr:hypothetical protein FHP24_09880 [Rhizobium smilacinae]